MFISFFIMFILTTLLILTTTWIEYKTNIKVKNKVFLILWLFSSTLALYLITMLLLDFLALLPTQKMPYFVYAFVTTSILTFAYISIVKYCLNKQAILNKKQELA